MGTPGNLRTPRSKPAGQATAARFPPRFPQVSARGTQGEPDTPPLTCAVPEVPPVPPHGEPEPGRLGYPVTEVTLIPEPEPEEPPTPVACVLCGGPLGELRALYTELCVDCREAS